MFLPFVAKIKISIDGARGGVTDATNRFVLASQAIGGNGDGGVCGGGGRCAGNTDVCSGLIYGKSRRKRQRLARSRDISGVGIDSLLVM